MNSKYLILAVIILAVIGGAALLLFGGQQSPETSDALIVKRADDGAELQIPRSSLPEGIDSDDISITRVPDGDSVFGWTVGEGISAYSLEPDGLEFKEEVLFKLTFDNPDDVIPMLVHVVDETSIKIIDGIEIDMDLETHETTITGPLSHFSSILLLHSLFTLTSHPFYIIVNENVEIETLIAKNRDQTLRNGTVLFRLAGSPVISGDITGSGNLAPTHRLVDHPPRTLFLTETYTIPASDYKCETQGDSWVRYSLKIEYNYDSFGRSDLTEDWSDYDKAVPLVLRLHFTLPLELRLHFTPHFRCGSSLEGGGTGISISDPDPDDLNCRGAKLLAPEDGGQKMRVNKLNDGQCYPVVQFYPHSTPDDCIEIHYHHELLSLGGKRLQDTQPCGSATDSDIVVLGDIWISPQQFAEMHNFMLGRSL